MMRLQKYSDMGGIDAVFDQFVMGQRVARDAPCWQTPKLGSSISHVYGKPDDVAMVEIFGARGQDLTYPEMKWWTDHMQVSGVNFLIPHSFNPRAPYDTDCPPYFYNGGFEPRWPLYRVFADYTSRLSLMLTGGRHVCPVALLFLGQQRARAASASCPSRSARALQDALYDCDWLPYEVFENDMTVGRQGAQAARGTLPGAGRAAGGGDSLRHAGQGEGVLRRAAAWWSATASCRRSRPRSARPRRTSPRCARPSGAQPQPGLTVCKTSPAGGRSYLLPEKPTPEQLQQVLAGDAGIHPTLEVLEGQTDHWLHVLHRVKARPRRVLRRQPEPHGPSRARSGSASRPTGEPECWDAMRNEITRRAVPARRATRSSWR